MSLDDEPCGERCEPLGASDLDAPDERHERDTYRVQDKLRALEDEHELLNVSLLQLTSHFAQVQFRLRQVVDAPLADKQRLLKSLEEFASCGVTNHVAADANCVTHQSSHISNVNGHVRESRESCDTRETYDQIQSKSNQCSKSEDASLGGCHARTQLELIERLTGQLKELQALVADTRLRFHETNPRWPLHKQRYFIDQLRSKLALDDGARLSASVIDTLNPYNNMKEQIVTQFKAQIAELERFIAFIQTSVEFGTCTNTCTNTCTCNATSNGDAFKHAERNAQEIRGKTLSIFKKVSTLLHIFISMQFGCASDAFKMNDLKETVNHWGDLQARVELAIARVENCLINDARASPNAQLIKCDEYLSDDDCTSVRCHAKVLEAVRKYLAPSVRDLMQHGLIEQMDNSLSLVPFMCFPLRVSSTQKPMHAWHLLVRYYDMRVNENNCSTPARQLSHSFNLDVIGSRTITNKQSLLNAIGHILYTHTRYKRSDDSQFKAFVSTALNENKLVLWLNIILQFKPLIQQHYTPWSYVSRTGFQDTLHSLDRLTSYKLNLPTDIAVRHFQNIRDAFL